MIPPTTHSGRGTIKKLSLECEAFGVRGLMVHGRALERGGMLNTVLNSFHDNFTLMPWCHGGGEPTLDQLETLLADAREFQPEWVASIGGGSVMDIGKACAGLLDAPKPAVDYHEGEALPAARIPFLAVPTTAGTGSEATTVSVLTNKGKGVKKSIRHPSHLPRVIILDSELLDGCPRHVVAWSGLDALTQAVESYVSKGATWFSDVCALKAVRMINTALPAVFAGETGDASQRLLEGSYLAGLALSHARLGFVHGLAHPLGCRYDVAHGLACAVCLPPVLEFNRKTIAQKYDGLSTIVDGDLLQHTQSLMERLGIESPFKGQPVKDQEGIVSETLASGSTKANPRKVTNRDVNAMLKKLF